MNNVTGVDVSKGKWHLLKNRFGLHLNNQKRKCKTCTSAQKKESKQPD